MVIEDIFNKYLINEHNFKESFNMLVDIIFLIAEFFLIFSYLCRNILFLRIGAALGMGSYSIGALTAGLNAEGMKTIFIFGVITVAINLFEILRIVKNNKHVILEGEAKEIHELYFKNLSSNEFEKIYNSIIKKTYKKDEKIIIENSVLSEILFLKSGTVELYKGEEKIREISDGFFLGEISFFKNEKAGATVVVKSEQAELYVGSKEELTKLQEKNYDLYAKIVHSMVLNLIKKLD